MKNQKNKSFSRELLKELLPEKSIIVEAGAHLGRDTIKLAQLFPQGTIHAFEPNPLIFTQLCKNTKPYTNIYCYPLALSSTVGIAPFYVSKAISALSSLHQPAGILKGHSIASFEYIEVPTITLDAWAEKYHIKQVDFIWLDLQGHELKALLGAQNLLKKTIGLLVEVNLIKRYHSQPLYSEIKKYLQSQSFSVHLEHLHHDDWGNVLFLKSESVN